MDQVKSALKTLIQGERDAVGLYTAFMKKAEGEGYNNISLLFKALVMAEEVHIKNHLNALGESFTPEIRKFEKSGSTAENLEFAFKGEVEENKRLYPRLIKEIKKESKTEYGKVAKLSMSWARSAEKEHSKLLKMAYKSLKQGRDLVFDNLAICKVCGNIVINKNDDKECVVCGHDDIFFQTISGVDK